MMFKNMDVLVVIPTYNEKSNISFLLHEIFSLNANISVLVIDDNSPDGTAAVVKNLQDVYSNLYLIVRKGKRGLGSAYIEGFKYALNKAYKIIVQMDGDLSHSPQYLIAMIDLLKKYDLVVGSRYIKGGGISNWPLSRLVLSILANLFSRLLLRIPVHDLTSGFKCMKREVLEKINFSTIKSEGYAFQIEMVYRAYLSRVKIKEHPIIFRGRRKGKSNMSSSIIIEAFFAVLKMAFVGGG